MTAITTLIADRLPGGLIHPGDTDKGQPAKLIPLPGLSSTGIPPEQAKFFADQAGLPSSDAPKIVAEALVHLIESSGYTIIPNADLEELRGLTAPTESSPKVGLFCHCNRKEPVLSMDVGRQKVTVDGRALRERLEKVCSCQ